MTRLSFRTIVVLALALLPVLSACEGGGAAAPEPLTVAVLAPFGERYLLLGQSVRNGAVLAAEEWNQRGGVMGRPVQIVLHDTGCDFETAREAALNAIEEDGVDFIVGGVCSVASEAIAQVAMREEVLQISPASNYDDILVDAEGKTRVLVFTMAAPDTQQAVVAANFALDELGAEAAAIIFDEDSNYGLALANAFEAAFEATEIGDVVTRESYARDDENFFDALEDIQDAEPDVIYMPGYYDVANRLVPQVRAFGIFVPIIGSDGWDSPELDARRVEGSYFTAYYFAGEPRPQMQVWTEKYRARYIVDPNILAAFGYDAMNVLLAAINRAGSADPLSVATQMEVMTFEVVTGEVDFDEKHSPNSGLLLLRAEGGSVVYVDRLKP